MNVSFQNMARSGNTARQPSISRHPLIITVNLYDCRLTLGNVCSSPFSSKLGCSQELLGRVLFVHVLFREPGSGDDLGQDPGTAKQLDFGEPRVVDESFRLQS